VAQHSTRPPLTLLSSLQTPHADTIPDLTSAVLCAWRLRCATASLMRFGVWHIMTATTASFACMCRCVTAGDIRPGEAGFCTVMRLAHALTKVA
jgi:hypothetical protein